MALQLGTCSSAEGRQDDKLHEARNRPSHTYDYDIKPPKKTKDSWADLSDESDVDLDRGDLGALPAVGGGPSLVFRSFLLVLLTTAVVLVGSPTLPPKPSSKSMVATT